MLVRSVVLDINVVAGRDVPFPLRLRMPQTASRDELPRLRWVRSTVPGVWEVLPADQTSFSGWMSDEDICDGVAEIEVTHFSDHAVVVVLGKRTRDDENEVQKVQYTVTGPSTVARELTLFTLQVWAMIQAGEELQGGDCRWRQTARRLQARCTRCGCERALRHCDGGGVCGDAASHGKDTVEKERGLRIASSDHNVRVPPSFEGNEFECCVTIFEELEREERCVFERQSTIPRSDTTSG